MMCKGLGWLSESGWSLGPTPRGAPPQTTLPEAGRRRLCCSRKLAGNLKSMGGRTGQWSSGQGANLKDGNVSDVHLQWDPQWWSFSKVKSPTDEHVREFLE